MTVQVVHATVATLPDEPGAEINKDQWNEDHSITGLGTAAEADTTDFATAAQGATADSAVQPGDLAAIATSGSGADLVGSSVPYAKLQNVSAADRILGRDSSGAGVVQELTCTAAGRALIDDTDAAAQRATLGLGTAATTSAGAYATAAQGTTADLAVQPGDLATVAFTGDYNDLINTPSGSDPVVDSVAYAASLALDWDGVDEIRIGALTGNLDITAMSNMVDGKRYILKILQDGTGGRAVTISAANVRYSEDIPSLWYSTTASKASLFGFRYDGTDSKADLVAQVAGY